MNEIEALDARVGKCEQDITSLMSSVNSIQVTQACTLERIDNLISTLGEIKQSVLLIQQKPAQRWESLVGQCIAIIAAALLGMFLGDA